MVKLHLIVRGAYDRGPLADGTAKVLETVRRTPVLYEQNIEIRRRESLTSSPKVSAKKITRRTYSGCKTYVRLL